MASNRSTESIIDLLYGELSPEEEAEVRAELSESAATRAELESFESLLGDVRGAMPGEEVSSSVHSSIMDAARAAAKQAPQTTPRRRPEEAEGTGLWRRVSRGQGSQFALVAAVLIAGVFVVKFLEPTHDPAMAPASDISSVEEPAPAIVAAPPADEPLMQAQAEPEALDELQGLEEEAAGEPAMDRAQSPPPEEPAEYAEGGRSAADKDMAEKMVTRSSETKRESQRVASKSAAPARKRSAAPASKPKVAALEDALDTDLFGDPSSGVARGNSAPSARTTRDDEAAKSDTVTVGAGATEKPTMAAAEPMPAEAQQAPEYRPQTGTIAAVEQRARANDYNGTIAASDEFLAADTGSATERARALQLKADALLKLGRYAEADRVYESIQKNYPTYQTSAVNAARATLQERLRKQPVRQERSAPKSKKQSPSSYDFESLE